MRANIALYLVMAAVVLPTSCKDDDNNNPITDPVSGTYNLSVNTLSGGFMVAATAAFTSTTNTFSTHVKTSQIGGGAIVKEFDLSGQKSGDSIFVTNYVFSLTDPEETITLNGRVHVGTDSLKGGGSYRITHPLDTIVETGNYTVKGWK
jgi:hypothetical protein